MSPAILVHLFIRGRVQGVGYRAWTERQALRRGLSGWVRNRTDGSVETLLCGEEEAVAAMIAACRQGPPGAAVVAIDQREGSDISLIRPGEIFSVLATV